MKAGREGGGRVWETRNRTVRPRPTTAVKVGTFTSQGLSLQRDAYYCARRGVAERGVAWRGGLDGMASLRRGAADSRGLSRGFGLVPG